jgi:hypothetical protein
MVGAPVKKTILAVVLLCALPANAGPSPTDLQLLKRIEKEGTNVQGLPSESDVDLWTRVEKAMTHIQAMRYDLVKRERLWPDKDLAPEESFSVKFRKPYDIYMNVTGGPNMGRHYLYRRGWPYMKVHVFGPLLQWMVPKIPPISRLALEGDHHAITDAAYDNTCAMIREGLLRNVQLREKDPTHPLIKIDPIQEVDDDGFPSYYYRSVNPDVFQSYTVTPQDKTIFDIGPRIAAHPYLLQYYNPAKVPAFDSVKTGDVLRYPLYYGRVTEFWVDRRTLLLHHIRITDFNGKLYEEYKYRNIRTDGDAALTDFDFDPGNPDYGGF